MTGVYQIQSKTKPERIYIGSAFNIGKRHNIHKCLLGKNNHHSPKLQNHYNKYGIDDLIFSVVEEFSFVSKKHLLEREQYYIDTLNPWFNTCLIAGSHLGIKRTEETKKKFRKPRSQETRDKISKGHKGKKQSLETILKRKESRKGYVPTEETKKKMSDAQKGKKVSDVTKEKLRIVNKGNKHALGNKSRIGRHNSAETNKKISEGRKRYFANKKIKDDEAGN